MEFKEALKNKVKIARKSKQLTQYKAAELIGIDLSHYKKIEQGNALPSLKVLKKFVDVLDITLDDVIKPQGLSTTYYKVQSQLLKCSEKELDIILGLIKVIIEKYE